MDNDKSILEKFTDTIQQIASTAANAAREALKAEEPPLKDNDVVAVPLPLVGGLVADPMMVPPLATPAPRRRRRTAARAGEPVMVKKANKKAAKKTARRNAKKSAAKKSATGKSASKRTAGRTSTSKAAERTTKRATKKRVTKKTRKAGRRSR